MSQGALAFAEGQEAVLIQADERSNSQSIPENLVTPPTYFSNVIKAFNAV
jgi:hypothetical protein